VQIIGANHRCKSSVQIIGASNPAASATSVNDLLHKLPLYMLRAGNTATLEKEFSYANEFTAKGH
jgi:hypothetical protein